ncbi:class I SAM-dependent methyltransferase [Nocardioides litoris]|uniref:class I SAM-dependent methyltransferase n=1 Tax=Nocardioides litoris TaxID=1926648 RepID=UPI00111DBB68|nr:class I SAM-dependent methyltransferase [Nocardioides litoris]
MTDQLNRPDEMSFSEVFSDALRGHPCQVLGLDAEPSVLPVEDWTRPAEGHDHALLDLCRGATLDIGCGPGRMTAALVQRGLPALGIDVVPEAVSQTVERGATAMRRDVFDRLPREGRWSTVLLADGNVGIGGDPVQLLRRVRELMTARGRAVVEVAPPGVPATVSWAALECRGVRSRPFRWAVLGVDDVDRVAREAGLRVAGTTQHGSRWVSLLVPRGGVG